MQRSKSRVGVSKQEKRLVRNLVAALREARLSGQRQVTCAELDCFQGVADIVSGQINGHKLFPGAITRKQLARLSFSTAKVLSALVRRKKSSISAIAEATGLSLNTVKKEVRGLERLRVVKVLNGNQVKVRREIKNPFKEIAAYEVKIKDWRGGLYQAKNYRSFANRATLVLPLEKARKLKDRVGLFRTFKVGLAGIKGNTHVIWLVRPRRLRPISSARNFLASIELLRKGKDLAA